MSAQYRKRTQGSPNQVGNVFKLQSGAVNVSNVLCPYCGKAHSPGSAVEHRHLAKFNSGKKKHDADKRVVLSQDDKGKCLVCGKTHRANSDIERKHLLEYAIIQNKQRDIVDRMLNNWELGFYGGGGIFKAHWSLQEGGLGRGGETYAVNKDTIDSLLNEGYIERVGGFRPVRHRLSKKGKMFFANRVA